MSSSPEQIIILYSKYSNVCKDVLSHYHPTLHYDFKLLCIDNVETRKRVSDKNITSVPSVVLVYPNKKSEIFQGDDIPNWIMSQFQKGNQPSGQDLSSQPTGQDLGSQPSGQDLGQMYNQPTGQSLGQTYSQPTSSNQTSIDDLTFTDEGNTRKQKSISEIASEMQSARDMFEKPPPNYG
jgi:hypothetical protein